MDSNNSFFSPAFQPPFQSNKNQNKVLIVLLGHNDKYLSTKQFDSDSEAESFLESIEELILANASGELPLKERLKLVSEYFPMAGAVVDYDWVDIDISS